MTITARFDGDEANDVDFYMFYVEEVLSDTVTVPHVNDDLEVSPFMSASRVFRTTGMQTGTNFRVRVSAMNDFGEGPKSDLICTATLDSEPDAPQNLVEDLPQKTHSQITVTWDEGSWNGGQPVYEYQLTYAVSGINQVQTTTERAFTITGLEAESTYTVRVRSRNAEGYSDYAAVTVVTATAPAPEEPIDDDKTGQTAAIIIIVVIVVLVIAIAITITLIILKDKKKKQKAQNDKYEEAKNTERAETEVRNVPQTAAVSNTAVEQR